MWEIIGYVLLGILALIVVLLVAPVYARITFLDELRVRVWVLGLPVYRYSPRKEIKPKAADKHVKPKSKTEDTKPSLFKSLAEDMKRDGVGTTLAFFKELAGLAVGTVRRVLSAVTVDKLGLSLYIAGKDAADTAEKSGQVCAVLYPAVTTVQQTLLRIRRRAVTVTPDFLAETGKAEADITLHVVPIRLIGIALGSLKRFIKITQRKKEVSRNGKQSAKSDGSVDR